MRKRWYWILLGLLLLAGGALVCVYLLLGRWVENTDITLEVDRSVTYRSAKDVETAKNAYADAGFAKVIADRRDAPVKRAAIVFDNLSETSTNEKVLKVIRDHHVSATFSVPGIEAAENDEFLSDLPALGCTVVGNTLETDAKAAGKAPTDMIESLVMTKNIIEGLVDKKVDSVFLNGTAPSRSILKTVAACGYENVIKPSNENLIDETTFETKWDVKNYVSKLTGDTIIMIEMEGLADEIREEVPVYPDKPAIDKKSDTGAQESEDEKEPPEIDEVLDMLLTVLEDSNITICDLGDFEAADFEEAWKEEDLSEVRRGPVMRSVITDEKETALAIYGLPSNLDEVLKILKKEEARATFFITGKEGEKHPDEMKLIKDSGNAVGNAGYEGKDLKGKSASFCFEEICKGADALTGLENSGTQTFMPKVELKNEKDLSYDDLFGGSMDDIRKAAAANGSQVIYPVRWDTFKAGDIVTIVCRDGVVDINEINEAISSAKYRELEIKTVEEMIDGSGTMYIYSETEIKRLRSQNGGKKPDVMNTVPTTARAAAVSLYGLTDETSIKDIFSELDKRGAKATYYVTYNEMVEEPALVERILLEGGEIGIAYRESSTYPQDYESVLRYINSCSQYLSWRFNTGSDLFMMPYGKAKDETKEAVSSLGKTLTGYAFNFSGTSTVDMYKRNAEDAAKKYENSRVTRGSILLFRPDLYEASKMEPKPVTGAFMEEIFRQQIDPIAYYNEGSKECEPGSEYEILSVQALLDTPERYELPDNHQEDIMLSNHIITDMENENDRIGYMSQRYVGNPSVFSKNEFPGFTAAEIRKFDKKGIIDTQGRKVIFLTFDDWGTDRSINHLLYVLEKHGVKGTFFVRTEKVDENVNLLRSIAADGHEIASHTKGHKRLSGDPEGASVKYTSLAPVELEALRRDVVQSYVTLDKYAGDVTVDGKKAVTKDFRPPTLAISKGGLETVFDVGFEHVISGSFSSRDYEAESAEALIKKFRKGFAEWGAINRVKSGSVIIMHMTENAAYTAEALDTMIPEWMAQGYEFARLDEYLK